MIKYIGSKRRLVPHIVQGINAFQSSDRVLDLFSGTSRVGHALKHAGKHVVANDHLSYAHVLARCYVQADSMRWSKAAEAVLDELSEVAPSPGYFTETFCKAARYFQPKNGARVDAIRDEIARRQLEPELEAIVLTSLMEAADRVDSTTGLQMAYLKQWAPRAHNDLALRVPRLLSGTGQAMQLEAVDAARAADVDVAYLDPPYNQHSYMGNYHIWETLVRWDAPEAYGIAKKRVHCREYKSPFNSKRRIRQAMEELLGALQCTQLLVSFNNEGHLDRQEMMDMLSEHGYVGVVAVDFKRYVGAQIGIYNPGGEKVGEVSHLRNKEYLFAVAPERATVERVVRALDSSIRGSCTKPAHVA